MKEIKRCPFCGGTAKLSVRERSFDGYYGDGTKKMTHFIQVICNKCHARGGTLAIKLDKSRHYEVPSKEDEDKAIDLWNRRESE